jgi:hypothetical protein
LAIWRNSELVRETMQFSIAHKIQSYGMKSRSEVPAFDSECNQPSFPATSNFVQWGGRRTSFPPAAAVIQIASLLMFGHPEIEHSGATIQLD